MERDKPLVFLSSTSDLAAERAALRDALRPFYELYLYEEDHAGRSAPETAVRERIQQSDVFVAVLGPAYGTSLTESAEPKSIVEWEFDTAVARESLEILTFVKKQSLGSLVDPRQQQFVNRVTSFRGGRWCRFFESGTELVSIVRDSLTVWVLRSLNRMKQSNLEIARWLHSIFLVVTSVSILAAIVVNVPPFRSSFTLTARVAVCAICASITALCGGLVRLQLGGKHD